MPRTDVPAPGQGKRSQKKAWRDNADRSIAIYGLIPAEMPEPRAIEDVEAMSHALPYWDDEPQPQPQLRSRTYTEEEVQELVEGAYQEGWQEGVEEGYKLGKDKAHKEYKDSENKIEEAKNSKKKANDDTTAYQDTWNTPSIVPRVNATTQTNPATPTACACAKTTHTSKIPPISVITASNDSQSLPSVHRDPTSSISPTANTLGGQIVEIAEIDHQVLHGGTSLSFSETIATRDQKPRSATSRNATLSTPTSSSLRDPKNVENAHTAVHSIPTSSNITQNPCLATENPSNDVSAHYVVYGDTQVAPRSNCSYQKKNQPPNTLTPESTISDTRNYGNSSLLVDLDTWELLPASKTGPDMEKTAPTTSHISTLPPRHPPLPSMQVLDATPYKRTGAPSETSNTLTEPNSDPKSPEKPTVAQQASQGHIPGNSRKNSPIADSEHHIQSLATPSFVIHAQTVVINNYASSNSSSGRSDTIFNHHAPDSPTSTMPVRPPRDLSALRSNSWHRPFSSLRRRSNRRQSTSARGPNWNNHRPSNWSLNFQSTRWTPPIPQSS